MQNAHVKFNFYRCSSKDMIYCLERVDDTSMQVETLLTNYSKLSSVTNTVQNMVALMDNEVQNLTLRAEVILILF